jgi:hypothetical protein
MQKQRDIGTNRARKPGRVGALGVVAAGALCAAVISIAGRMPPDPVDHSEIPGIEIGKDAGGEGTQALRPERRLTRSRRAGAGRPHARGERAPSRKRGGAPALAHRKTRGDPSLEGVAGPGPQSGEAMPERLGPGTGPTGGSHDSPSPGTRANGDDDDDDDGDDDDPPSGRPVPAVGPAPSPPASGGGGDDRGSALSVTGTAREDDDDDVQPAGGATPPPDVDADEAEGE